MDVPLIPRIIPYVRISPGKSAQENYSLCVRVVGFLDSSRRRISSKLFLLFFFSLLIPCCCCCQRKIFTCNVIPFALFMQKARAGLRAMLLWFDADGPEVDCNPRLPTRPFFFSFFGGDAR